MIEKGTWVEIHDRILRPEERTGNLPEETKRVPLEMRLKGFLQEDAELGDRAVVKTVTGRLVKGTIMAVNPTYDHGYGEIFIPELLSIGRDLKALLEVDHE